MRLELSAEDQAFREEMRTFFTTQVPQEIRDTVIEGRHLSREQIVESQRILNAAGLAVPHWPTERAAGTGPSCGATSGTTRCSRPESPRRCPSTPR